MTDFKEIQVGMLNFKFQYIEQKGLWYLGSNEFDVFQLGYVTDITIDIKEQVNWVNIHDFLSYITRDFKGFMFKIEVSNIQLKKLFQNIYSELLSDFKYEDLFFTLCNVQYKNTIILNNEVHFEHILSFNVESKSNIDFFTYDSWNAYFVNNLLITVSKS